MPSPDIPSPFPQPEPQTEQLRHSQNEMIIGLTESPQGRRCIGMTFAGREWSFLTARPALMADRVRVELETQGIETLPGAPFNWRGTVATGELTLLEDTRRVDKPVGIFVPADKFDEIINSGGNF